MRWSTLALAAGSLGVAGLLALAGSTAIAQEERAPQGLAAEKQVLDRTLEAREAGNEQGAQTQKKIDALADETDELLAQYRTTLKQIDSIRVYNRQMRELIASQESELASVADQLDRVEEVGRSVTPLMLRMIDALDAFVKLDVPFLIDERTERVANLREIMNRADVTNAEKYRQIMEAYQIENEFGRTIEAYRDTLNIDGRETTVDLLRFGRIALVYQALDESVAGVWNQETRSWQPLDSSYRSAIRNGLRIARKQAAPDLIRLPLPAADEARTTTYDAEGSS